MTPEHLVSTVFQGWLETGSDLTVADIAQRARVPEGEVRKAAAKSPTGLAESPEGYGPSRELLRQKLLSYVYRNG